MLLEPVSAADRRPNVVFIMADDLGWRDLGCFGSKFHQTPNLDKLAARGMKFTQAYAANPLCSPTRSSVLTGLWPARTGITAPVCHVPQVILEKKLSKGNPKQRVLVAESVSRLKTDYITLPKLLKEAGYATGHFGKWHLGAEPYSPLQHGFEVDFPHWPGPGPAGSYVAPWKFPDQLKVAGQPGEHIEDTVSAQVVKFIRDHKEKPFFLNYWTFSVHAPYDAKDDLVAKYRTRIDEKNPQCNPVYGAMVESLDDAVGRVMAALEENGLMDKTIIVFTSDNGGVSWPGKDADGVQHKSVRFQTDMKSPPTSNLPLRNGKASLYEGGVREPCIVHWPGVAKPGSSNDTVIQSIDWMPTLLEMTSVPLPPAVKPDGISIVPAIKGEALQRDAIFCHFPHDTAASDQRPGTSVRRGDWKLIRLFAANEDGSDRLELYNLKSDLGEATNLAASEAELTKELNALIESFLKSSGAVIPMLNPNFKREATQPATKDPLQGWKARGCTAVASPGVLKVSSTGDVAFLGFAAGGHQGPTTLKFRLKAMVGEAKVEWLSAGPKDKPQSVPYKINSAEMQEMIVTIPATGPIGIVRIYLPKQVDAIEIESIEISSDKPRKTTLTKF